MEAADREKQKAFAEGFVKLSDAEQQAELRSILDIPTAVKIDVLKLAGWTQLPASLLWIRPEGGNGAFLTLEDAYQIELNRKRLNSQPCALQEAAADWIRKCKAADELERDLKKAHHDVGLASDALDGFFREVIREKPLVLTVDGVLYVVTFYLGNLRYEEAVSPEGVQV